MHDIANNPINFITQGHISLQNKLNLCSDSKVITYKLVNPQLTCHDIYKSKIYNIDEYKRIEFSRFRLSAHKLNVEKGRWVRPITPINRRFCPCGHETQNEQHVLVNCPLSDSVRLNYPHIDFNVTALMKLNDYKTLVNIIYEILRCYY